jgi:hypothetical protein
MLTRKDTTIRIREADIEEVKKILTRGFESAVGHQTTADFLTKLLGIELRAERKQVTLTPDTILVVFQLLGRLPEGRVLTEEELSKIPYKFYLVEEIADTPTPPQRGCSRGAPPYDPLWGPKGEGRHRAFL